MKNRILKMLDSSPVNFLAAKYAEDRLNGAGYQKISLTAIPELIPGKGYYITKNNSAVFAFRVGTGSVDEGFKLICAHTDSPCFRVKPSPEMVSEGGMIRLNTEVYGGPILYTWFDRPLSLAGRVILRGESPLSPKVRLLHIKRPLLIIPHLAIHFNREVNEGNKINRQKDMMPVLGFINEHFEKNNLLLDIVARELDVDASEILDFDLSLYEATPACLCGMNNEFISSGRQDDLLMAFAGLEALIESAPSAMTQVLALFDNEETGNMTKQGSASPMLRNLLDAVIMQRGGKPGDLYAAVEKSFMVSADMAHALHPNYADKHDPTNHPVMGGGPVIKYNANQKYVTDAESAAVFAEVCRAAGVPFQTFVNRSDIAGGSTLGNTLTTQLPLRGVDMGNPMWGMHSARETSAVIDTEYAVKAFTKFYEI
ncbi:MAG: M18 family aminopeptidase [Bacteroidaceae bacterium]|nr:M18 family aminopeptidase [Bacteroidaceae bacterium]